MSAWQEVTMPALSPEGAALWPERWPADALAVRRGEVGDHDWESLFQQHPVARRGRVFPAFDRRTHVVRHAELERQFQSGGRWLFRRIVVGTDWGWTHPGAMIVLGQTGAGAVYALHEEWHRHRLVALVTDASTPGWLQTARDLRATFRPERFVADPSEPGNIAAMRRDLAGNPVVEGAMNDVAEGIRRMAVAMAPHHSDGRPRFFVSDACPRLIHELETYSYRAPDVPQDVEDDATDACRYAVAALTR